MRELSARSGMHYTLHKSLQAHPWGLDSGHPWPSTLVQTVIHTIQNLGVWLLIFISFSVQAASWQTSVLAVDDTELTVFKVLPTGKISKRVLWIPSEYGVLPEEKRLAEQLAKAGVVTTFFDPFEALFLAPTSSALQKIPAGWVAKLLNSAKFDFVIAGNQGAALALKGLQAYYQTPQKTVGVILLNPDLLTETPLPGEPAIYQPVVSRTNLPVMIVQGELSPWRWQLPVLQTELMKGGAQAFFKILPQVRDRFYFRPDANDVEKQMASTSNHEILQAMQLLSPLLTSKVQAAKSPVIERQQPVEKIKTASLQRYQGE